MMPGSGADQEEEKGRRIQKDNLKDSCLHEEVVPSNMSAVTSNEPQSIQICRRQRINRKNEGALAVFGSSSRLILSNRSGCADSSAPHSPARPSHPLRPSARSPFSPIPLLTILRGNSGSAEVGHSSQSVSVTVLPGRALAILPDLPSSSAFSQSSGSLRLRQRFIPTEYFRVRHGWDFRIENSRPHDAHRTKKSR
jgi:hypothetical protein